MISTSQTPGMKLKRLIAVTRDGNTLDPRSACFEDWVISFRLYRSLLGFIWALVDPEHLTWADKVSGTFLKKSSGGLEYTRWKISRSSRSRSS